MFLLLELLMFFEDRFVLLQDMMHIRRGLWPLGMYSPRTKQQPSEPPKPQTSPQGGGLTLPLPPPYRLGPDTCSFG